LPASTPAKAKVAKVACINFVCLPAFDNLERNEMLLKLRLLAYDADDVLDYFRIQDELDGNLPCRQ
jgi:hypothetical protein